MSKINYINITLLISLFFSFASANDSQFQNIFKARDVKGTLIISSLKNDKNYVYNQERATKRYLPASTFKIPNTLIALDEGAVKDENEIIKWDGKIRAYDAWNRDQNLKTALPKSCVWFYQELAQRVGNDKYLKHLQKIAYGNKKTGSDVSTFWLEGEIKISASEQIDFLKKLYKNELPYKKEHLDILKKIMLVKAESNYTIRAKTGLVAKHGWYVGYVETKVQVCFFALNIDIDKKSDIKSRKEIVMEALKIKNII
ncbi:periplasmic penicillin-binding transpeptidase [Sulfurimonas gotlandica GD1]|uniref:Beta-lactamase n=1 Tax=Sulfurimonas gotlandica (strain DSM 19862 / JCM 16533 / GD1) TaxID=929558 RepID=H1FUA3_SULGG|nr:periplasmic penicillin-binding transpeptidase [Sulfurimonas gotlandica GD1]